jgi:hypothetical protein
MQQVQKVNDYCTRCENCSKSRRRVGHTSSAITVFARVAYNIFSTIEQKNEKKNDKQQISPVRRVWKIQ